MSGEATRDLIAYRLEQADRALAEAQLLHQGEHLLGAVNRAYYAMFYAIQALLAHSGLKASKHIGAISLFDREFVRTELFDKSFSRWLHELFALRQDSDYSDMFLVSKEQATQALKHAEVFLLRVKGFLRNRSK
jgi:uncharacterized protein (UPF0332 family)